MHDLASRFERSIAGLVETVAASSTEMQASAQSMATIAEGRPLMVGVAEGSARFDELKLSARVFFANKTAVAGLVIFLVFVGDALLVQIAPGVLGVSDPNSVIPPELQANLENCSGTPPEAPSLGHLFGTTQYPGLSGIGCIDLLQLTMKAIRINIAISFFIVLVGAAIEVRI